MAPQTDRRLVLVPYPSQGHINPMFQLAALLRSQGLSVTIVLTGDFPSPNQGEGFTFVSVPVEVPTAKKDVDHAECLVLVNANVEEPLRRLLEKMRGEDGGAPDCLIVDSIMYSSMSVAEKLGLPVVALKTGSAASMNAYHSMWTATEKDNESNGPPGPPPRFDATEPSAIVGHNKAAAVRKILSSTFEGLKTATGLILNTIEALEPFDVAELQRTLGRPVYPIGPLHHFSPVAASSNLWVEDRSCIDWLDEPGRPSDSVLYVSFGSVVCIDRSELMETAWGLADSGQPFLWVLREGSVRDDTTELPEEFWQATRGRGKVVRWAPQKEVLRHPAVGGFWTHCGWNSTLESVCEGVPMICWPRFADQPVNASLMTQAWRVGISLPCGDGPERGEVSRAVRRLMVEGEGKEMRSRAAELKAEAHRCVADSSGDGGDGVGGGTSMVHLGKLVGNIMARPRPSDSH